VFRAILFAFALASFSHAFEEEWVKKYAFAAGMDFVLGKGDFDGKSQIYSRDLKESVILPKIPFFLVYAFEARALANASSIIGSMGLGYPDYKHSLQNGDARYLRLGIEYQYHFFWPSDFRIGLGIGYAFSSMRFSKASIVRSGDEWDFDNGDWRYANFTGNGPHAVLSFDYYFSENFAVECGFRYRLLHLNRVATDREPPNDVSKLNSAVLQHLGEPGLKFMFVF
jgi:hypothetical protein